MTYKKTGEALRDEHAVVGGIALKKVAVFDNAGNQITNFGGSAGATVSIGSSATIFAVVNTAAAGQASIVLDTGASFIGLASIQGNVNLNTGTNYIGSASVNIGGTLPALSAGAAFIGLATVVQANSARTITGNITLSDSKGFIGLTTVVQGGDWLLGAHAQYIGLATVDIGTNNAVALRGNVTLSDSKGFIGLTTVVQSSIARTITGNLTLSDAKTFIGLTTTTLGASPAFIGIATVANRDRTITGNVTLSDSKTFIGLVTATALNAGTLKTLIPRPIGLGNNSLATIAVPTNANKINVTSFVLNSNITTEIALKSGVTYLTGNASLGVTLFPGGGYILPGSPDSPSWIGLPSGALVVEKRDSGGTVSKVAGGVVYFDE